MVAPERRWLDEHLDERLAPERASEGAPIDPAESAWVWRRPRAHQVPQPKAGDRVRFREQHWGPVREAVITQVFGPDPDLVAVHGFDPHYQYVVTGADARPVLDLLGRRVLADLADPWPLVELDASPDQPDVYDLHHTREGRNRGSAGWLPADWVTRYRPRPGDMPRGPHDARWPRTGGGDT